MMRKIHLNESPKISVLANLIRYLLAKLLSDSPLATWRVVSAIPALDVNKSYYDKKVILNHIFFKTNKPVMIRTNLASISPLNGV